ncbi:putative bifunctional diguanylate cyclase/phosphodiesterase [Eubacterium sp.]|uniref:putative bifunctional diguanylate cyclase/phosphodiesterase n=1 Tax=Eubacterium sp. TaxID=142586 RepID=UPI002FC9BD76
MIPFVLTVLTIAVIILLRQGWMRRSYRKWMTYDRITGVYNRLGFLEETARLLDNGSDQGGYAILSFNIKGFKIINLRFDEEVGDDVLIQVARALAESAIDPLVIGRMESDHFVCLVRQQALNYSLLTSFCQQAWDSPDGLLCLNLHVGVYLVQEDSLSVAQMCDRAKLAKGFIEDGYTQPYAIYRPVMENGYLEEQAIVSGIQRAIAQKEIVIYYQPIVDARTDQFVSAEALVRWTHPERGLLFPGGFIPVLERSGYITALDRFVAHGVSAWLAKRQKEGKVLLPVSINLSRMDFYDDHILDQIGQILERSGIPSGSLGLEITETALSSLTEANLARLRALQLRGVSVAIDDFGTEYASFATLLDFEQDIIKLDFYFIRRIGESQKAEEIIASIIQMAHSIGAKVVAEGVEKQGQADFLRQKNCDYLQGYLYAKPMTQDAFEKMLDQRT